MIEDIYEETANELSLDKKVVKETYKSYWKVIRNLITELPLKEDMSEEDFDRLRCNFNIPSLGKLYVEKGKYFRLKKAYNQTKNDKSKKD